ncbi:MAG TPA: hypothetical protein VGU20_01710 [Stellaceae bacterium]|nr:hypothetical protein [Stellaceae bacterium]
MAFKRNQPTSEPADAPFQRIDDDPDYAKAIGLLQALERKHYELKRTIDRLTLEELFRRHPHGEKSSPRYALLFARLESLRAEHTASQPLDVGQATSPEVEAGLDVIRGGTPALPKDHAAQIAEAKLQLEVVGRAIGAQTRIVNELRSEKSLQLCHRLQPLHRDLLLEVYRAAQALARTTTAERKLRAEMMLAGYEPRPDVIGAPGLAAAVVLGSEDYHDSQLSFFRRHLEQIGVLK